MTKRKVKEDDPFKEFREVPSKPKKKSFFDRFKRSNRGWSRPRFTFHGFKRVLALLLAFVYVIAIYTSMFSSPVAVVLMVLTLWIILDYVKQTGKKETF